MLEEVQKNWPVGIKRTRQRETVLSVLESSEKPLSATDIASKMEKTGDNAWLSTVYRVLELFVKKGVVIKTNMMNNEMALYELWLRPDADGGHYRKEDHVEAAGAAGKSQKAVVGALRGR